MIVNFRNKKTHKICHFYLFLFSDCDIIYSLAKYLFTSTKPTKLTYAKCDQNAFAYFSQTTSFLIYSYTIMIHEYASPQFLLLLLITHNTLHYVHYPFVHFYAVHEKKTGYFGTSRTC